MIDGSKLAASIDAIDYSGISVRPEYIDANGHMNVGYYGVVFDRALEQAWTLLGLGWDLIESRQKSSFTLESHFTYQREVKEGDPLSFTFRLLDFDAKRMHMFAQMWHAERKYLAATYEQLVICIDMRVRKSSTWPEEAYARLAALHTVHRQRPVPAEVGRLIGIRRRQERAQGVRG